jgi:FKBP-type peptidyl-prolyl cis-trans isomerase FklB
MLQSAIRAVLALSLGLTTTLSLAADPAPLADDAAKTSYSLGYQLGHDMTGIDIRTDALAQGMKDGQSGAKSKLSSDEMTTLLTALQKNVNEVRAKRQAEELQKTAAAGAAYVAENGKRPGVQTTASGLQYKVLTPGTGPKPTATDTVTVNYRGTLVDGTEFDSSYSRGQPASFPVNGVIAGWTEALQLMQQGAKWQITIPPTLAYGDKGPLANQVLIFDVELLKVGSAQPGK